MAMIIAGGMKRATLSIFQRQQSTAMRSFFSYFSLSHKVHPMEVPHCAILQDDILFHIFGFITESSDWLQCMLVCQQWYHNMSWSVQSSLPSKNPLFHMAMKGNLKATRRLLSLPRVDVNGQRMKVPLAIALCQGHDGIVTELVRHPHIRLESDDIAVAVASAWSLGKRKAVRAYFNGLPPRGRSNAFFWAVAVNQFELATEILQQPFHLDERERQMVIEKVKFRGSRSKTSKLTKALINRGK
ncbi:hypothetical protein PROFUN_08084 [Planoprotostelium fungivorum]|uniref:F-box domain-containing protein n=1 Tax=Planoprotostelium fungivorum TaxID=1890364 RepID=A0A2P6NKC6_9EUKA|nr:hypothetical protein PROFUN_08084 [Planoprotostelium fungivorum]